MNHPENVCLDGVEIVPLHAAPAHLEQLADWHGSTWRHLYADWDAEAARQDFALHGKDGAAPITWLALKDGSLGGSVSLVFDDLPGWPAADPWLANFLVAPHHRRQGIGSALMRVALAHADVCGWPRLLLFTESAQRYFVRFGFRPIGSHVAAGHPVHVMARSRAAQEASSST